MGWYRLNEALREKGAPGPAIQMATRQPGLPPVACDACGRTWSSHASRVRNELPREHPLGHQERRPVPPHVFREMAQTVREVLQLGDDVALLPGTDLGYPRLTCRNTRVADFEFPDFRTIIISDAVRVWMEAQGFTGWHPGFVRMVNRPRKAQIPKLHELVVDGRGEVRSTPAATSRIACEECGRLEFDEPVPESVEWVEQAWDGSDIVRLNAPLAGGVYVSERVREALESSEFTNWRLTPIDDEIRDATERIRTRAARRSAR